MVGHDDRGCIGLGCDCCCGAKTKALKFLKTKTHLQSV